MRKSRHDSEDAFDTVVLISPLPPPFGGIARWTRTMVDLPPEQVGANLALINTAHARQRTDETSAVARAVTGAGQLARVLRQLVVLLVRPRGIACVHVNTSGSMGLVRDVLVLSICRALRRRTVLHMRFGRAPEVLASRSPERTLLRAALKLASATISIDERTHEAVSSLVGEKAILIPNFIQVDKYDPTKLNRSQTVVFLGSVGHSKGIDELVQAWNSVGPSGWTLKLVGPLAPSYADPAWQEGLSPSIQVLGPKDHDEAMQELSRAAVLVLPSHTEGFPNVVLEAMASGTPVIATDVGAIATMLADDAGVVVPAKDADALADALNLVLSDDERRGAMADKAFERVRAKYSTSAVMQQYRAAWRVRSIRGTSQ